MKRQRPWKRNRVKFETVGPSKTKQSFKEESEINTIMAKYERTGIVEHRNEYEGDYGNFLDGLPDYHAVMNEVRRVQDMFGELPSGIRAQFKNDAGEFLDFVQDPANDEALVEMGLKRPPAPQEEGPGVPAAPAAASTPSAAEDPPPSTPEPA